MHEVKGVVARSRGAGVEVVKVLVPPPGPGEALVRPLACGVCHTDLHFREGMLGDDFPYLLGHEAAGVVEAVGEGVSNVAAGDHVILAWRAPCGACRSCLRGRPWYCFASLNAHQRMTLEDGTPLTAALGIGGFAALTLVAAGQCVPYDDSVSPAAAGLVGCGIMAGYGAALNTGGVTRGDSVAVFGCGGVGCAAIAASHLAGAARIVAVDIDDRKLALAGGFGATDLVNAVHENPVERIRSLTGGFGVDVAIEAVGQPKALEQAFFSRDHAGVLVLAGVAGPEAHIDLPMAEVFGRGGSIRPSWYGDALPTRDFPVLIDLHRRGMFDLEAFISDEIALGGVEEAFTRMHGGAALRSVVRLG